MAATVRRKIHFLKVKCSNYDFGKLLEAINALPEGNMYSKSDGSGGGVYLKTLYHQNDAYYGSIVRLRMTGLPSLARQNKRPTEQLELADDQGLAECTHFIYFEKSKVLVVEYNHYGPRIANLEWHVIDRCNKLYGEPVDLVFEPIFNRDAMRVLSRDAELSMLLMSVPREKIDQLEQFDSSIHGAFKSASSFGNGGKVEVIIRMTKRSGGTPLRGSKLLQKIKLLPGEVQDTFDKLKVSATTEGDRARGFDLLENQFSVELSVPIAGRSNELNAVELFNEMRDAYQLKYEELMELSNASQII